MKIHKFYGSSENTAICLGDFDGVHMGHRQVFKEASKTGDWGALIFTHNSKGEKEIMTLAEKLTALKKLGAKYVVSADFDGELKGKSPQEFVEFLKGLKVRFAVTGYDYRFGKDATGDVDLLKTLCTAYGIETVTAKAKKIDGMPVKSTIIRKLITDGKIKEANTLLGSPYIISGKVEEGFQNGLKMGFPTANLKISESKLLPKDGVYKGHTEGFDAVINIGKNPTFEAKSRTVEVHIIGMDKDLYGKELTVEVLDRIRDEIKFKNCEELVLQIKKDIESVKGEK